MVTTGAVVSGATTTCSPFASLVFSISTWSRFTRFPLSLSLLVSLPRRSFPIRRACRRHFERARGQRDDSAPHKLAKILPAIREAHPSGHALLCSLRESADRSMQRAAPASRNSRAPGGSVAGARGRLRCASFQEREAVAWLLPPPRARGRQPWLPPRDTKLSCCPRCARAIRQAIAQSGGPREPQACHLPRQKLCLRARARQ